MFPRRWPKRLGRFLRLRRLWQRCQRVLLDQPLTRIRHSLRCVRQHRRPPHPSIGKIDGFGAHGAGVVFRYCRAWNNSDDVFDLISSRGANLIEHCWAFDHRAGGDSNGFKIGGFGIQPNTVPPDPVPVHTVRHSLAANNDAHGFYANHHPGGNIWLHNTAFNNRRGNFNLLERSEDLSASIPGFRQILHHNLAHRGRAVRDDAHRAENVAGNSWTIPGRSVTDADFLSLDIAQLRAPRGPGNNLPYVTFMRPIPSSALAGLGCFAPPAAKASARQTEHYGESPGAPNATHGSDDQSAGH